MGGAQGKKLFWMEYGVGGGISQDGSTVARSAAEAAATPFFGIFGPYNSSRDPFANAAVRGYRNYFFGQTINYLVSRGVLPCSAVPLLRPNPSRHLRAPPLRAGSAASSALLGTH